MSAKIAKSTATTEVTEKFAKELNKFFSWAKDDGYVISKSGDNVEWSLKLLKGFEEPGRNKLDAYIKGLMKKYVISKDDEDLDDYKVILKDFKENKPKRKRVDTSTEGEAESPSNVIVDNTLDTNDTYYLETLECDTNTLLKKLGKPIKNNVEKNRFEWKVKVDGNVYSIYDWLNEEGEFDSFADTWWHVGGVKSNKKDIKKIVSFLKEKHVKKQKNFTEKESIEETEETSEDETEESIEDETEETIEDETEEMNDAKASLEETEDLFGELSDLEDELDLETVE